jgi:hypothetical protein
MLLIPSASLKRCSLKSMLHLIHLLNQYLIRGLRRLITSHSYYYRSHSGFPLASMLCTLTHHLIFIPFSINRQLTKRFPLTSMLREMPSIIINLSELSFDTMPPV